MGAGGIECLFIADAETYHTRIAQVHVLNLLEVGLFPGVEILLRAGGGCRRHHINESVGVGIYLADALFAGFGGDEHDDADVVFLRDGLIVRLVFPEGQVGDDDAVDATFRTCPAEGFKAEVQDRIEISHQYQRYADIATDVTQLVKEDAERHSVAQGAGGGILNDDAVRHGVAEGDADFYHIHSVLFERADNIGCAVERGAAGTKVDRQQVLGAVLEKLVDTVHSEFVIMDLLLSVTLSAGSGATCRQVRRLLFPEGISRCVPRLFCPEPFRSGC